MKEAVMKVIDTLTQEDFQWGLEEVVGTVHQVHCSRRRLLHWGSPMARETWVQSQVVSLSKTLKMVLDTTLLNTQHYKVQFKGKVEQSWDWSSALPWHLGIVAIQKGAFGSPSTMVANFTTFTLLSMKCPYEKSLKTYLLNLLIWFQTN